MEKQSSDKKIKECEKLKEEYLAGWKRARADFLNYQKEEAERTSRAVNYAKEDWLLKIISLLDNIDIAESKIPQELKNNQWVEGILQVRVQISDFLRAEGVEEIESAGVTFNPAFHEAVLEAEAEGKEPGIIIEEIKKGYIFNNKVLRPAKVKISK